MWNAHALAARREGVSDALVDAIRDKAPLPSISQEKSVIINYCREFYRNHKVRQENFDAALQVYGPQHLVELTALIGNYAQTAFFLNAFEVQLPGNRTEPVLPV